MGKPTDAGSGAGRGFGFCFCLNGFLIVALATVCGPNHKSTVWAVLPGSTAFALFFFSKGGGAVIWGAVQVFCGYGAGKLSIYA